MLSCERNGDGKVTFIFDRAAIEGTLEKWLGNIPMPLDDARKFLIAQETVTSVIREVDEVFRR